MFSFGRFYIFNKIKRVSFLLKNEGCPFKSSLSFIDQSGV